MNVVGRLGVGINTWAEGSVIETHVIFQGMFKLYHPVQD